MGEDSSEDESKFQEAAIAPDTLLQSNKLKSKSTPQDDKPASLRRNKKNVIDNHDMLNVTPEYKAHVASKLSGILQKSYKEITRELPDTKEEQNEGINFLVKAKTSSNPDPMIPKLTIKINNL